MKQENISLKICVGYHKPSLLLEGECFVPIWGGKACISAISKDGAGLSEEEQQWMNEYCLGDDTGDNISIKNRNYCEATILYWMWKTMINWEIQIILVFYNIELNGVVKRIY